MRNEERAFYKYVDWIFQWILVIGRTIGATLARARQDFKKKSTLKI